MNVRATVQILDIKGNLLYSANFNSLSLAKKSLLESGYLALKKIDNKKNSDEKELENYVLSLFGAEQTKDKKQFLYVLEKNRKYKAILEY